MKSINELRDAALRTAVEHGFTDATIGEDVALMHSELSELLENFRDGEPATKIWYEEKRTLTDVSGTEHQIAVRHVESFVTTDTICGVCDGRKTFASAVADRNPSHPCPSCLGIGKTLERLKPCGIPSELADVLVRAFHFAGKHKIDLESAVMEKMAYNESRPYKHGNKKI